MAKERETKYAMDLSKGCYMYYFRANNRQYWWVEKIYLKKLLLLFWTSLCWKLIKKGYLRFFGKFLILDPYVVKIGVTQILGFVVFGIFYSEVWKMSLDFYFLPFAPCVSFDWFCSSCRLSNELARLITTIPPIKISKMVYSHLCPQSGQNFFFEKLLFFPLKKHCINIEFYNFFQYRRNKRNRSSGSSGQPLPPDPEPFNEGHRFQGNAQAHPGRKEGHRTRRRTSLRLRRPVERKPRGPSLARSLIKEYFQVSTSG